MAGVTAALFTTPFDVVKTRIQTQVPFGKIMDQIDLFFSFLFLNVIDLTVITSCNYVGSWDSKKL
jgi:Mitochondrial carrier protein